MTDNQALTRITISLPAKLADEVKRRRPDVPFSRIVRQALEDWLQTHDGESATPYLARNVVRVRCEEIPELRKLSDDLRGRVDFDADSQTLIVDKDLEREQVDGIRRGFANPDFAEEILSRLIPHYVLRTSAMPAVWSDDPHTSVKLFEVPIGRTIWNLLLRWDVIDGAVGGHSEFSAKWVEWFGDQPIGESVLQYPDVQRFLPFIKVGILLFLHDLGQTDPGIEGYKLLDRMRAFMPADPQWASVPQLAQAMQVHHAAVAELHDIAGREYCQFLIGHAMDTFRQREPDNWRLLVLRNTGMTQADISQTIQRSTSWVSEQLRKAERKLRVLVEEEWLLTVNLTLAAARDEYKSMKGQFHRALIRYAQRHGDRARTDGA